MREYFNDFRELLRGHLHRLPVLVALFLISGCLDIAGLGLIGQYIANIISAKPVVGPELYEWLGIRGYSEPELNRFLGLILLTVFAAKAVTGIVANYAVQRIAGEVETQIRANLLLGYQLMPYREWVIRNSSEYINAINLWVTQFTRFVFIPVVRLLADGLVAILIMAFFIYMDWRVFVVFASLLLGVGALYGVFMRGRIAKYGRQFRELSVSVISDVRHATDGLKEIRILGAEKYFNDRIRANVRGLCSAVVKLNTLSQTPRQLVELAIAAFVVVTVSVITTMGESAASLLPVFGVFAAGAIRLTPTVGLAANVATNLGFYRETVKSLASDYRLFTVPGGQQWRQEKSVTAGRFEKLQAVDVFFAYEGSKGAALRNVNLEIRAGEAVVFVGQSGAGKTTLVDLLLGLLEPTEGEVVVNGDLRGKAARILRGKVAYLPQNVFLIDDTLRRNIALGEADELIDDQRVLDALRRAKLGELVNELPQGLDGMIGDRGLRLSGGQRQRVALARALYFNREIIVLDEATNAIDYETEQAIIDEIMALRGEKTLIAITHRPGVTRRFDKVYRIRKGEVAMEKADKPPLSGDEPVAPALKTTPEKIRALETKERK